MSTLKVNENKPVRLSPANVQWLESIGFSTYDDALTHVRLTFEAFQIRDRAEELAKAALQSPKAEPVLDKIEPVKEAPKASPKPAEGAGTETPQTVACRDCGNHISPVYASGHNGRCGTCHASALDKEAKEAKAVREANAKTLGKAMAKGHLKSKASKKAKKAKKE
jgi:hypothetical protein